MRSWFSSALRTRAMARSMSFRRSGSGSHCFRVGLRNDAMLSGVTPRAVRSCARDGEMPALSESARACSASLPHHIHRRAEKDRETWNAGPDSCGAASVTMRALMARPCMPRLDPTDGSRRRAHHDALGRVVRAGPVNAVEHRSVGDPGRSEDHVAGGQIVQRIFAIEIGDAETASALAFFVVAEDEPRLDLAADAAQRRGSENAFGRAA